MKLLYEVSSCDDPDIQQSDLYKYLVMKFSSNWCDEGISNKNIQIEKLYILEQK